MSYQRLTDLWHSLLLCVVAQGGYNVESLITALDSKDDAVASAAQKALSSTLLVFDFLYDVDEKRKAGNKCDHDYPTFQCVLLT